MGKSKINIYQFNSFREYLKSFYQDQKANTPSFSLRNFAKASGIKSPSFLTMVINGERSLSAKSISQFAKGLDLNKKETTYFEALVFFEQASSEKERDYYLEKLIHLRPKVKLTGIKKDKYDFYKHYYYPIVQQMAELPDFSENPEWIAKKLTPQIKKTEAAQAISSLLRLGMLKKDKQGLSMTKKHFATPTEVSSLEVKHYHRTMLSQAKESLFNIQRDYRDFKSLTSAVPIELIPELKEKINSFLIDINSWIDSSQTPASAVYQLNLQLFPLTSINHNNKKEESND